MLSAIDYCLLGGAAVSLRFVPRQPVTKPLTLRLTPATHQELDEIATAKGIPLAELIRSILLDYLARQRVSAEVALGHST